jgi:hypothetical protein
MSQRERMRQRALPGHADGSESAQRPARAPSYLHIEHLVVEGIAPSERDRFVTSLHAELQRAYAQHLLRNGIDTSLQVDQLAAGDVAITSNTRPEKFGEHVAKSLQRSLGSLHASSVQQTSSRGRGSQ